MLEDFGALTPLIYTNIWIIESCLKKLLFNTYIPLQNAGYLITYYISFLLLSYKEDNPSGLSSLFFLISVSYFYCWVACQYAETAILLPSGTVCICVGKAIATGGTHVASTIFELSVPIYNGINTTISAYAPPVTYTSYVAL